MIAESPRIRRQLLLLLLVVLLGSTANMTSASASESTKTYYETLEVDPDASLTDIKKAYRRLALLHHPDRNKGREKEAEVVFRQISEAYEILSDDGSRREYDASLRHHGGGGGGDTWAQRRQQQFQRRWAGGGGRRRHRDPFAQFNDLFQNDPFFREAARGMDDLFDETFRQRRGGGGGGGGAAEGGAAGSNGGGGGGGGFFGRLMNNLGVNFEMTTSSNVNGRVSSTSTSYGRGAGSGSRGSGGSGSSSGTYTSRSTRTVIENGRRVTIQSLERDGNKIEEKYVGETLVQRLINGVPDKQIGAGDET